MATSPASSEALSPIPHEPSAESLKARYCEVRCYSEYLCEPLETEDYVIQSMPDCSPTKWHIAHTSWFFETFLLKPYLPGYESKHPQYNYLFNSYYNAVGERHCRPKRGLISRPTVAEAYEYREEIDRQMLKLLETMEAGQLESLVPLIDLGLNHEQQHQELIVTDLKHVFASNPLRPVYRDRKPVPSGTVSPLEWQSWPAGVYEVGYGGEGFAFDNEGPRHKEWLNSFALASRLVTCGEYLSFMEDGGYERPELWLSMGWNTVQDNNWQAPFYWEQRNGEWWLMTLAGMRQVELDEPVCHVSYFEADAYARWSGARLPTEAEWEVAASKLPIQGNFVENGHFHPVRSAECGATNAASDSDDSDQYSQLTTHHSPLTQMFGDVWQWTRSQYTPYPGYVPDAGALGEYNGKFMCNQFVLRGGSCASSRSHIRATYRNFFPPDARWQFTGIRLTKDI